MVFSNETLLKIYNDDIEEWISPTAVNIPAKAKSTNTSCKLKKDDNEGFEIFRAVKIPTKTWSCTIGIDDNEEFEISKAVKLPAKTWSSNTSCNIGKDDNEEFGISKAVKIPARTWSSNTSYNIGIDDIVEFEFSEPVKIQTKKWLPNTLSHPKNDDNEEFEFPKAVLRPAEALSSNTSSKPKNDDIEECEVSRANASCKTEHYGLHEQKQEETEKNKSEKTEESEFQNDALFKMLPGSEELWSTETKTNFLSSRDIIWGTTIDTIRRIQYNNQCSLQMVLNQRIEAFDLAQNFLYRWYCDEKPPKKVLRTKSCPGRINDRKYIEENRMTYLKKSLNKMRRVESWGKSHQNLMKRTEASCLPFSFIRTISSIAPYYQKKHLARELSYLELFEGSKLFAGKPSETAGYVGKPPSYQEIKRTTTNVQVQLPKPLGDVGNLPTNPEIMISSTKLPVEPSSPFGDVRKLTSYPEIQKSLTKHQVQQSTSPVDIGTFHSFLESSTDSMVETSTLLDDIGNPENMISYSNLQVEPSSPSGDVSKLTSYQDIPESLTEIQFQRSTCLVDSQTEPSFPQIIIRSTNSQDELSTHLDRFDKLRMLTSGLPKWPEQRKEKMVKEYGRKRAGLW